MLNRISRDQWALVWAWVGGLIGSVSLLTWILRSQLLMPEAPEGAYKHFFELFASTIGLYSTFLTTMLSVVYARRSQAPAVPRPASQQLLSGRFLLAVTISLFWNAAMWYFLVLLAHGSMDLKSMREILSQWFGGLTFLVNAVVGFYFGTES